MQKRYRIFCALPELDPNFAQAYATLGGTYYSAGQTC